LILDLDASYMRSYSPNVYPNPTDLLGFNRMATQIQSCTVARDPSQTRQYGSIPMKMVVTGDDPYAGAYGSLSDNLASALSGQTWTISVWAKASVATTGELFIFGANTNGAIFTTPDYSAGTISITNSWQRFSFSYTFTNANTRYIQFRLDGTISGGSGITIWWDGLQVERASAATNFNPYYFGNTSWRDTSGNSNNGTLTSGPTFSSSNKGNILFDGVDDYVSITNVSSLRPTTELAIEMVVKAVTTTAGWNHLFGINPYTSYTPLIFLETGGQLIRALHFVNGVEYRCNTNETISTSVFKHVVFTFKPGDAIRSYFNGVASTTNALPNGALNYNTSNAFLISYLGGNWPNVQFALVRMYNKSLTQAEVSQNYEATKTRFGL
jgi:hypothetical protein